MRKVGSLNFSRVKPMTYKTNCRHLACHMSLLGYGKDWLAQHQDNEIPGNGAGGLVSVGQYYKVAMIVHCHKSVPVFMTYGFAKT